MSITKDFEIKRVPVPMEEWNEHGTFKYWGDDVERLLKHTRALESMLERVQRVLFHDEKTGAFSWVECPVCSEERYHSPDCQLAKLLEEVE